MNPLAAIHVARKQLGLDDDTYRAVLERVTGKSSAADMNAAERLAVLDEFRRLGFEYRRSPRPADPSPTPPHKGEGLRRRLDGKYAPKLQALWIAGWNLGVVRDRRDKALLAFVKRQTGIEHTRFLHYPDDAAKAIEALKGWLAREGGVDWSVDRKRSEWTQTDGYRIVRAQLTILVNRDPVAGLKEVDQWIAAFRGNHASTMTEAQWIEVMNALGEKVRALPPLSASPTSPPQGGRKGAAS